VVITKFRLRQHLNPQILSGKIVTSLTDNVAKEQLLSFLSFFFACWHLSYSFSCFRKSGKKIFRDIHHKSANLFMTSTELIFKNLLLKNMLLISCSKLMVSSQCLPDTYSASASNSKKMMQMLMRLTVLKIYPSVSISDIAN